MPERTTPKSVRSIRRCPFSSTSTRLIGVGVSVVATPVMVLPSRAVRFFGDRRGERVIEIAVVLANEGIDDLGVGTIQQAVAIHIRLIKGVQTGRVVRRPKCILRTGPQPHFIRIRAGALRGRVIQRRVLVQLGVGLRT